MAGGPGGIVGRRQTWRSHINMQISQEEQLGSKTDHPTEGPTGRRLSIKISGFKNVLGACRRCGEMDGSRIHSSLAPVKRLAALRNRVNSQRYSSIYEDRRPKIEDIERSDSKKSA